MAVWDTKTFPSLNPQQVGKPSVESSMEEHHLSLTFSVGQRMAKTFPCLQPQKVEKPSLDIIVDDDDPTFTSCDVAARRLLFEGCESGFPHHSKANFPPSAGSELSRCLRKDAGLLLDVSSCQGEIICRALPVAGEMPTREIKHLISDIAQIDVADQRLFYRGSELHDQDFPLLGLSNEQRAEFHLRQRSRNISLPDGSWFCGTVRRHVSSSSNAPIRNEKGREYTFHGLGTMRTASGDCYSGQWRDHQRDGEGRVDYANGDVYQGTFRNNQRCGHGRFEFAGGDVYNGEFVMEEMSGEGELRRSCGEMYTGQFLEGRYHGVGRQVCPDGGVYAGEFVSGKAHGECVNHLVDGSVYKGQFCNGAFDGNGIMSYADGHEYSGHFVAGMMEGDGVYRSPDKNVIYEGQFVEDEGHGRGRYFSPSGFMYEGEFCNDMFHGRGALHHEDGRVEEGCFEDGILVLGDMQEPPLSRAQVRAAQGGA